MTSSSCQVLTSLEMYVWFLFLEFFLFHIGSGGAKYMPIIVLFLREVS